LFSTGSPEQAIIIAVISFVSLPEPRIPAEKERLLADNFL